MAVLIVNTNCSALLGVDDECNNDEDCTSIGSDLECREYLCVKTESSSQNNKDTETDEPNDTGPWRCLGSTSDTPEPTVEYASVQVYVCNFITDCADAVTGLSAQLCDKRDVGCANPQETDIVDVEGELSFEVPTSEGGFDGYLQITPPAAMCTDEETFGESSAALCELAEDCDPSEPDEHCMLPTFAPAMLFFNPPIVADVDSPYTVQLLPSPALPAVVEAAGATLDPTTGNMFITALDCDGTPAADVVFELPEMEEGVAALYVANGVVSQAISMTDESGIGGFVGVRPGFATVTGYTKFGKFIGEIGLQTEPFTLTYSALVPASSQ